MQTSIRFTLACLLGSSLALVAPSPLIGRVPAGCDANNCLRAVAGTRRGPDFPATASSDCSAYQIQTVTTTYTPATYTAVQTVSKTATVTVNDTQLTTIVGTETETTTVATIATAHVTLVTTEYIATITATQPGPGVDKRGASPSVPSYASACTGVDSYASACSCLGITATQTTVTITAATPTATVTTSVTFSTHVTVQTTDDILTTVTTVATDVTTATVTVTDVATATATDVVPYATGCPLGYVGYAARLSDYTAADGTVFSRVCGAGFTEFNNFERVTTSDTLDSCVEACATTAGCIAASHQNDPPALLGQCVLFTAADAPSAPDTGLWTFSIIAPKGGSWYGVVP